MTKPCQQCGTAISRFRTDRSKPNGLRRRSAREWANTEHCSPKCSGLTAAETGQLRAAMNNRYAWLPERHERAKKRFLQALAATGRVSEAAKAAGYSPQHLRSFQQADPQFAAAWQALKGT